MEKALPTGDNDNEDGVLCADSCTCSSSFCTFIVSTLQMGKAQLHGVEGPSGGLLASTLSGACEMSHDEAYPCSTCCLSLASGPLHIHGPVFLLL